MPTRTDMPKPGQIYVLSIAISRYQSAEVSNLNACETDADQLKVALQQQFDIPEERYLVLKNEQATRSGIIQHFRQHFGQLEEGDIAVFHYSGHGSWEDTSPAFVEAGIEHYGGRNEVMVVHDYGSPGIRNLADKELRWLISEVEGRHTDTPKSIHFVGLMDCCYSGSIFRTEELLVRRTELSDTKARPLSDYLEGQYEQQYQQAGQLHLPEIDYVMLSACGPREYALETDAGGLFTQSLIQLVAQSNHRGLSYAELFFQLRNQIQANSHARQNPYLHYQGQVHPYQGFLNSQNTLPSSLPLLTKRDDTWVANIGALQGIQATTWRKARIPIYRSGQYTEAIAYAKLQQVALEHTLLTVDLPPNIDLDQTRLVAGLHGSPLPITWEVSPPAQAIADRLSQTLEEQGLAPQLYEQANSSYRLRIQSDQISIWQAEDLLTGIYLDGELDRAVGYISYCLGQVVRWEQVRGLRAPAQSEIDASAVELAFTWFDQQQQPHRFIISSKSIPGNPQIIIPFPSTTKYILYRVEITNLQVYPLYAYLIHLDRKFGMRQLLESYDKPLRYEDGVVYDSKEDRKALGIKDPLQNNSGDNYIIIVSKEKLHYPQAFQQMDIGMGFERMISHDEVLNVKRGIGKSSTMELVSKWSLKRFECQLIRS